MVRLKILVTGANGQLGSELRVLAPSYPQYEFIFLTREELSLDNPDRIKEVMEKWSPQYCINCAAYTAVDKAESEKDIAFRVNAEAVGMLAAACRELDTRLIHISTDYVFDGKGAAPYAEDAPVDPQSVYGASKLEGERKVMEEDPRAIIIRTSWVYSAFGKNFVKTMINLMKTKPDLNVVSDQIGSPTYAADLASAIINIIVNSRSSINNWAPGIYHFSNEGVISWYDFAVAIRDLTGSSCRVHPIPSSEYPTPAKRPAYSVLNKTKIQQKLGIPLKDWKESLGRCIVLLKANSY